jgi:uncharacterized protein YjbJ (UPF0337 family)
MVSTDITQDALKAHWNQLRSYVKERWPEITDNELDIINGDRERLIGALQEHYWIERSEAAYHVREFEREFLPRLERPAVT